VIVKTQVASIADNPSERTPTLAAEQRIRQIVREAARLFDKVGYHMANMEMVAQAVQMRKPTLYHYIKSKEEILLRIHQTLIDDLVATHQARLDQGLNREGLLLGIVTDILRAIADNRGYVRAFLEHYRELDPAMREQISGRRQAYFKSVTDLIADGVADGAYHTDDVTLSALFLLGQVNWAYQWYVPGVSPAPEVIAQKMIDNFLYGLTRATPASPKAATVARKTPAKVKAVDALARKASASPKPATSRKK
jgi:TetR/AcrR family transcriptional regulator, cholesterol catabolism regulator